MRRDHCRRKTCLMSVASANVRTRLRAKRFRQPVLELRIMTGKRRDLSSLERAALSAMAGTITGLRGARATPVVRIGVAKRINFSHLRLSAHHLRRRVRRRDNTLIILLGCRIRSITCRAPLSRKRGHLRVRRSVFTSVLMTRQSCGKQTPRLTQKLASLGSQRLSKTSRRDLCQLIRALLKLSSPGRWWTALLPGRWGTTRNRGNGSGLAGLLYNWANRCWLT